MKIIEVLNNWVSGEEEISEGAIADMQYKYRLVDVNKPIVITFPTYDPQAKKHPKAPPFGFDLLCRYDVNIISFKIIGEEHDNYFMHPDFSRFIELLGKQLCKFKVRLGYSNSKGGFGIGTYAKTLGLDSVLLFFPVSTKNITLVPWDKRKSTQLAQHLDWNSSYNDVDLGDCKGFVLYDPADNIDVNHAKRFKGLKHVKINGLVHGQGYNFLAANSDCIKNIISNFVYKQDIDMLQLREEVKLLRLTSFYYDGLISRNNYNKTLLKNKTKLERIINHPLNDKFKTLNETDIDEIRDIAIELESIDLLKAKRLMSIAHKARPEGPLIKRKLNQYKRLLTQ